MCQAGQAMGGWRTSASATSSYTLQTLRQLARDLRLMRFMMKYSASILRLDHRCRPLSNSMLTRLLDVLAT